MKNGALSILDALADRLGSGAAQQQTQHQQQQLQQLQKEQQARCETFIKIVVVVVATMVGAIARGGLVGRAGLDLF